MSLLDHRVHLRALALALEPLAERERVESGTGPKSLVAACVGREAGRYGCPLPSSERRARQGWSVDGKVSSRAARERLSWRQVTAFVVGAGPRSWS